jgi:GTP pyrophosphokinase
MTKLIKKVKKGFEKAEIVNSALDLLKSTFKEGEFLFAHSLRTVLILKEMGVRDEQTLACGILHHVPLSSLNFKNIPQEITDEISKILKKVNQLRELCSLRKNSKPTPIKKWQKTFLDIRAENLRKMIFGISRDLRPIFVLLAGRLDEMRNLQSFPKSSKDYQQRKSKEALEILAPLAYGVGMGEVKGELEDLAFPTFIPQNISGCKNL